MKCDRKDLLLYGVTDRAWVGEKTFYEQVEEALRGGVTILQLREKDLDEDTFLEEAKTIREMCKKYGVPFIINDHVEIACRSDADGVHVGQSDMEAGDVRSILGEDKILGVSVQTVEQALLAEARGADYLGVGAVFPTDSKADAVDVSYETLSAISDAVHIPVVAIGGIGEHNIEKLKGSGICGVAVISAIFGQPDIYRSTQKLKKKADAIF